MAGGREMKVELNKVYRDEYGEQWKIIAKHRDGIRYIGVPSTLIDVSFFTEAGGNCYNQLTELVGDDFKKEAIFTEFNADILSSSWDRESRKEIITLSINPLNFLDICGSVTKYLSKIHFNRLKNLNVRIYEDIK